MMNSFTTIKQRMQAAGVSQRLLSELTSAWPSQVNNWVNQRRGCPKEVAAKLEAALSSVERLLAISPVRPDLGDIVSVRRLISEMEAGNLLVFRSLSSFLE